MRPHLGGGVVVSLQNGINQQVLRDFLPIQQFLVGMTSNNVALLVGDGTIGWRKYQPFDVIVVSAASPSIPPALVDQLADGGRMLIPVGSRDLQELVHVQKTGFLVTEEIVKGAVKFVPLLGQFAWKTEGG